jgi:hypothetical protein
MFRIKPVQETKHAIYIQVFRKSHAFKGNERKHLTLVYAMRAFPNLFSFTFPEGRHPLNSMLVGGKTTETRTGCLPNV